MMTPTWSLDPNLRPIPYLNNYGRDNMMVPAQSGEYMIPSAVVRHKGTEFFDNLIKKSLEKVMPQHMASMGGTGSPETGYAVGGPIGGQGESNRGGYYGGPQFDPNIHGFDPNIEPSPLPNTGGPIVETPTWNTAQNPNVYWGSEPVDLRNDPSSGGRQLFFDSRGYFPPIGTPGWGQGPTMIPTYFDPQGYPYAVPVNGWNPPDAQAGLPNIGAIAGIPNWFFQGLGGGGGGAGPVRVE